MLCKGRMEWSDEFELGMCDRKSNWFLQTRQEMNKVMHNVWGNRVDEPLLVLVWLVLKTEWIICWWLPARWHSARAGGAHSHWAITADWHPDFNPYTSQLWRDRPPLLCQHGLRAPLCDAGSFQPCDPWRREKRPKRVSGLTLALCTQRNIFNSRCIIEGLLISGR